MSVHLAEHERCVRHPVPVSDLLLPALGRIRRQGRYARVLARGGSASTELMHMLTCAADCVATLARPVIVLRPVSARVTGDAVEIAGRVTLKDTRLARDIDNGGSVTAYLLTLGYAQADAFDLLGRDYAAHHVQTDLAGEVLFALGRCAHRMQKLDQPGGKIRRISVQMTDLRGGAAKLWDAARVHALIGCFDGINPGVTVTDAGCFQPLNSLLGLSVRL